MTYNDRRISGALLLPLSMLSILSTGAIFGFFYAWVCSTMWGLDSADPRVSIASMQAMNGSVRNAVFFPAFFLTPIFSLLAAVVAVRQFRKQAAALFLASAVTYIAGAFVVTIIVNIPMNEALASVSIPSDVEAARSIWEDYSQPWQVWNTLRTVFSGVSLLFAGYALTFLRLEKD